MPGSVGELERSYQQLEVLFDRLQMIYRPLNLDPGSFPAGPVFRRATCRPGAHVSAFGDGRSTWPGPPDDLPGDFDPMYLGLGLDAFVAWRAESGQLNGNPILSWRIVDGSFEFRWHERRPANGSRAGELRERAISAVSDQMNGSIRWLIHCSSASSQLTGVQWRRTAIRRSSRRSAGRVFRSASRESAAQAADNLMTRTSDPRCSPLAAIARDFPRGRQVPWCCRP